MPDAMPEAVTDAMPEPVAQPLPPRMPALDATAFIQRRHEIARAKLAEIEETPAPLRAELWRQLEIELKVHELVEDVYLFTPLAQDAKAAGTPLAGFQARQNADVARLEVMMQEADALDPAGGAWLGKVLAIRDALAAHTAAEEAEVLPGLPAVWTADQLRAAGAQMMEATLRQTGAVAA